MSTFQGFQGFWEQDDNAYQYFLRKILNKISVERLIFCRSSNSLKLKWGKLPVKAGTNRGVTATQKPLVAIGGLHGDLREPQK